MLRVEELERRETPARFLGTVWPQPDGPGTPFNVTYNASSLLTGLGGGINPVVIDRSVEAALGVWAAEVPVHFVEVPTGQVADITFRHEDLRSSHVAFASGPSPGGVIVRLDTEQLWSARGGSVTVPFSVPHLTAVLAHEIGHALGLDHAEVFGEPTKLTLMSGRQLPTYQGLEVFLFDDDRDGITSLYGAGKGSVESLSDPIVQDSLLSDVNPFLGYLGTITKSARDQNGDGVPDITAVANNGHVKTIDGVTGQELASYLALGLPFSDRQDVSVAIADQNGDGVDDVFLAGGGRLMLREGNSHAVLFDIVPFVGYEGSMSLAVQYMDEGGGPVAMVGVQGHVKLLRYRTELASFFAYDGYRGVLQLAGGISNNKQVLVSVADNGHIKTYDPTTGQVLTSVIK